MTLTATLVGNLTADPRVIPSGTHGISFSVAVNHRKKVGGEWADDGVDFVDVSLWGDDATAVEGMLTKGTRVIVRGDLRTRSYQSASGGGKSLEIRRATVGIVPTARRHAVAPVVEADPWATDGAPGEPSW